MTGPCKQTILVVEDDEGVLCLERRSLERAGFAVLGANRADQAFDFLRNSRVDLVLLDFRLDDELDGLEFYERMRRSGLEMPVILVTGFSNEATVIKALRLGVRDYVTKNLEYLDYLPDAVERVLRQVRLERQLAESERRFRTMADHAPAFIWMTDAQGACVFVNEAWLSFVGRPLAQECGEGWFASIDPADGPRRSKTFQEAVAARQAYTFEFRARGVDGAVRWIFESGRPRFLPDGEFAGFLSCGMDVTSRKSAEAMFQGLLESAPDAFVVADEEGRVVLLNSCAEALFGATRDQAVGSPVEHLVAPPERHALRDWIASASDCKSAGARSLAALRRDGRTFAAEVSLSVLRREDKTFLFAVFRDVTERQEAQARIREQAALLDQANDAIIVCDIDDRVQFWNGGAERLFGWTSAEVVGERSAAMPVSKEAAEADRLLMKNGRWTGELRQFRKNGEEVIYESSRTLLRDPVGRPRAKLIINTDVTQRKKLESYFMHAQKMEGIGRLAGGVAHDFNNLLTVINGFSEVLLSKRSLDSGSEELLKEIRLAGERAAALTRHLLAFSRKQILQPRVIDLNVQVREMEKMVRRLIGEDIDVRTSFECERSFMKADPGQIEQVIVNLVVNSRDAMPSGGTLRLSTAEVTLDETSAPQAAGRYVRLSVSDTGIGMDEETKARIFEPFFTTKEPGRGTGLGLATVYGIVKQSGGWIDVRSKPGIGSTFCVYFPSVEDEKAGPRSAHDAASLPRGTETILLVEDDRAVRSVAKLSLESLGYRVLEASDGQEGLELSNELGGAVHLVVTDLIMPRLGGREMAETIRARRPDAKVLFLSGYADDSIVRRPLPQVAFLQKPFTPSTLARRVREAIDRPDGGPEQPRSDSGP